MAKNDVIILVERETFEMEGKVYYRNPTKDKEKLQ